MKRLAIIGAGDLGRQVAHHALGFGGLEVAGFFDDTIQAGTHINHLPVFGGIPDIISFFEEGLFDMLFVGIGYRYFKVREEIYVRFSSSIPFANLIHPSVTIDPSARVGNGVLIHPGCTVGMNATIGDNVLIFNGSHIAHDSAVGAHSVLAPGVTIAGNCTVGKAVFLGVGTILSDGLKVDDEVYTGAGAVVVADLTEPGLYVGCPARLLRKER
jgi:sugar O-acyltransferase (sialic acid O-acetyltransferase NeuD family)